MMSSKAFQKGDVANLATQFLTQNSALRFSYKFRFFHYLWNAALLHCDVWLP